MIEDVNEQKDEMFHPISECFYIHMWGYEIGYIDKVLSMYQECSKPIEEMTLNEMARHSAVGKLRSRLRGGAIPAKYVDVSEDYE